MRFGRHVPLLVFALLVALTASVPFATTAGSRRDFYFFDVELTSNSPGATQLFFDMGRGIDEPDSSVQPLRASARPVTYRYMMPTGTLRALRLDPIDREATMTLGHARIVNSAGRIIREFPPANLQPANQIATSSVAGSTTRITTTPGAFDPYINLVLDGPLELRPTAVEKFRMVLPVTLTVFATVTALGLIAGLGSVRSIGARARDWFRARPIRAVALAAGAAVAVQCHPVIFFGKSFVSPDNAVFLLYGTYPTLPGYQSTTLDEAGSADVGAMMWQHASYPVVQRAALEDGELPFWNRYDLAGTPLLGQGQSMFGDPLNWMSILASGSAGSWDVRFVVLRFLFAFGTGLAVWLLTRQLAAAAVMAFGSVFIGFFAFRYNHPAILSVCWGPWLLVAWIWLQQSASPGRRNASLVMLGLTHATLLTSGTMKEATMMMACLDVAGVCLILASDLSWRQRLGRLGGAALTGLVFLLVAAPLWLTFLDTLGKSRTSYDVPAASQLPLSLVIGFFEDLFYRQLRPDEAHYDPSSNGLVLLGVLWALLAIRNSRTRRSLVAVLLASALPFGFAFGLVPASLIVRLPFVANIIHIDNTFSCALLVLAAVLAGFGLAEAIRDLSGPHYWRRHAVAVGIITVLTVVYFSVYRQIDPSPFFRGYVPGLAVGAALCPLALSWAVRRTHAGLGVAAALTLFVLLLWRHGQYLNTAFDRYVMNPKARVDLTAGSPAVEFVRRALSEPARTVGLGYNLFPGYNQFLRLESIYGVDAVRNAYLDELAQLTPMHKVRDWVGGPPIQEDIGAGLPMQDLLNVRYYLASPQPGHELPGRRQLASLDLDVYESPTAWPRAFFTDTVTSYGTPQEFVALALTAGPRPFAALQQSDFAAAQNEMPGLPRTLQNRQSVAATDYRLTANTTSFTVRAPGPGVIVLTEAYYPDDFQVHVNGSPAKYFRVNHAFKGLRVAAAGTYRVEFVYRPARFGLALGLAVAGVLLGAGSWIADALARRRGVRLPS